jgi:ribose/xylose/arabinose/galactoside ABC-type transport system permease subunit
MCSMDQRYTPLEPEDMVVSARLLDREVPHLWAVIVLCASILVGLLIGAYLGTIYAVRELTANLI